MSGRERTIDEQSRVGEQEHTQVIAYHPSKRPYLPLKRALYSLKRDLSSLKRALSFLERARIREQQHTHVIGVRGREGGGWEREGWIKENERPA